MLRLKRRKQGIWFSLPNDFNIDIFNEYLEKILVATQKERKYAFLIGDNKINTRMNYNINLY